MHRFYVIYSITNPITGMRYIGLSNNFKRRKKEHLTELRGGYHHNEHLQHSFVKHGENVFTWDILEDNIPTIEIASKTEIDWIARYGYENTYNQTTGGEFSESLRKPCTWNGIEYESITEAAKAVGISDSSMHSRLKNGYTHDSDIPDTSDHAKIPCTWNGIEYSSISEAARVNNITPEGMWHRVSRGYTGDNDLRGFSCIWNGVIYRSIAEAARQNGVTVATMRERIMNGYTSDDDLKYKIIPCIWNGIEYSSILEAAKANGVKKTTMWYRIKKGYTSDDDLA